METIDKVDDDQDPITTQELEELEVFLAKHHPPLSAEFVIMREKGLLDQLPLLQRCLFDDMRRFQAGKETRNVTFLND